MANVSRWRIEACKVIELVIKTTPNKLDLVKAIDNAYPFGERKYTPYKIWLEERRKALVRLNLYTPPKNRKCPYHPDEQTCLFCMSKSSLES